MLFSEISTTWRTFGLRLNISPSCAVFNKNKDIDEIKNFINKLKNVYLNKLIVKPSSTPSNSPFILQKLQAYFRCLSTSLQKDQLRFVITENIEPELLKSPWVDQLGINNASINSITIDSFLYSPYIKGVSDYKNYALNKYNGSMLYMLIYKTSYSKNKTEIIKKLEGIKKQTFGTKFLIYAISNYKQNTILEYLSEQLPLIQKETDEIQQNFCETIYHLIYNRNSSRTSSISTKAGLFKSYMDKKMSVSKNAEIESFLKRTVPYNNHYSYVEQAKSLLKELIGINQDAFEKVYEKASKNLKNVRTNSTRNGVVQTYDMILQQSISESVRTIKEFLFIQKFNKKQIKTSYTFNNNVMNIVSNEFVSLYKNKFSELNKLNKEIQSKNRINSFLYAIRKVSLLLKKDLVPYNIYSIKNSVYDKKERENILDTLSKDAEFNLLKKDSQFINELLADLKYSWASPQSNQIPSDFLQVISKRFNNSELSNSQKIAYYTLYYKKFANIGIILSERLLWQNQC